MKSFRIRLFAGILAAALSISLLSGCASNQERQTERLSREEFRLLYPRQYYESLSPWEQQEVERKMMEQEWEARRK